MGWTARFPAPLGCGFARSPPPRLGAFARRGESGVSHRILSPVSMDRATPAHDRPPWMEVCGWRMEDRPRPRRSASADRPQPRTTRSRLCPASGMHTRCRHALGPSALSRPASKARLASPDTRIRCRVDLCPERGGWIETAESADTEVDAEGCVLRCRSGGTRCQPLEGSPCGENPAPGSAGEILQSTPKHIIRAGRGAAPPGRKPCPTPDLSFRRSAHPTPGAAHETWRATEESTFRFLVACRDAPDWPCPAVSPPR
jgi:hypothetical protein